jgi:microcystin-dependent protein
LADFNANKRLPTPDSRGRAAFGKDDMGGASAANRITSGGSGIAGTTLGATGGAQTVTLGIGDIPSHTHDGSSLATASAGTHSHAVPTTASSAVGTGYFDASGFNGDPGGNINTLSAGAHTHTITGSTGGAGGGAAHQNVPPAVICNFIIKL